MLASNAIIGLRDYTAADPEFAPVQLYSDGVMPELPLSNAIDPDPGVKTRFISASPVHTKFWVDLGAVRDLRLFALLYSNCGRNAVVRRTVYEAMDTSSPIIGAPVEKPVYPAIYDRKALYPGHPSFWDLKISPEDAGRYPMPWLDVTAAPLIGRYVLWEIFDEDNASGFPEFGRVVHMPGWQLPFNFAYGSQLGLRILTQAVESLGGGVYFDKRTKKRFVILQLPRLRKADAGSWVFDGLTIQGIDQQVFFCADPTDQTNLHRWSFLGYFKEPDPLEFAYNDNFGTVIKIEEAVGLS